MSGLDEARAFFLARLGAKAPSLLRDRERRVAVVGLVAVGLALALTAGAPAALLAVGPVLLGVPHLVADARYLLLRPGLHRRAEVWLFVVGPAAATLLHRAAWVGMLAVVGAAAAARTTLLRRALAGGVGLALVVACAELGRTADLVLVHAHNAVAVGIFWAYGARRGRLHLVVVAAFVLAGCAIVGGLLDGAPATRLAGGGGWLDVESTVASLSPSSDPTWSLRLALLFAFAQSVHYAVWVRLVPEQARSRPGIRSFGSSLRALEEDLGRPLFGVVLLVACGIAVWGAFSLAAARDGYLRLAIVHGPLELGAATVLLLERVVPSDSCRRILRRRIEREGPRRGRSSRGAMSSSA